MNKDGYWERLTDRRLSRRRVVAGSAGLGAGAAALSLVGCGGGSKSPGGDEGATGQGLISTPKDSTSQVKPGGTLKSWAISDITTMDPIASPSFTAKLYFAQY